MNKTFESKNYENTGCNSIENIMGKYRTNILLFVMLILGVSCFSQYNYIQNPSATYFTKRIEYNYYGSGLDNVNSKTDIEKKVFFPEHNSLVEFFILPSFSGSYGFCIDKDNATNKYYLVYKHIANWEEVEADLYKKYPRKSMKMEMWDKLTDEEKKEMSAYNRKMRELSQQEALSSYSLQNDTMFISQKIATAIHSTFVTLIRDFVGQGNPGHVVDGYNATFRCVVKDEVWTFTIKTPQEKFGKLTELCNQMIESIKKKDVDESKYLSSLNEIIN